MSLPPARILMTGAAGRLGTELRAELPGIVATDVGDLDITDPQSIAAGFDRHQPLAVLHAAAYTDVAGAETHRAECWRVNVEGTRNIALAARDTGLILIHISTDYVFEGTRGGYREEDPLGPPVNYYALSKLVAEELARTAPRCLVIRTSFRPREWPYESAFTDVHTSQDYIDIIAPRLALVARHADDIPYDTLHIGTERKSIFELARRRKPDVRAASKEEVSVPFPSDISMDIGRWEGLCREREWHP
ncbi:MAG: sugar nucleotide-binding protein [Armatimonadia bacterium]|nr:sugar nucleotide-binding protein [Armatimonadia bacterium]